MAGFEVITEGPNLQINMSESTDYEIVKERVLTEYYAKVNGRTALSFSESMELREYAESHTDLRSECLTPEQDVWKSLHIGLTEELRKAGPDLMAQIEALEERREKLEHLDEKMAAKMKACPNDYGVRVWWGFVIIGLLIGWMRSPDIGSILLNAGAFWIAGAFFCIFAVDSAEVQSRIAIFLQKLRVNQVSEWLYKRALTIR